MEKTETNRPRCGGGETTVSAAEARDGWIRCPDCGKTIKIRARRDQTTFVPYHTPKSAEKTAYISPPQGVLELSLIRDSNPRALLTLDLGIPNFTVFSMTLPLVENQPQAMSELMAEAIHVLCDEVANFMLVMDFKEEVIVQIYGTVLNCYKGMSKETDTDKEHGEMTEDDFVKVFVGTFNLPQAFVNETQNRVVTAAKVIKRPVPYRKIELSVEKPAKTTVKDVARVIRQYRGRSLKTQPKPLFVVVYDQLGRPSGTLPLGPQFKNKLLNLVKKGGIEFTGAVQLDNEHEMRYIAVDGIPSTITIDSRVYSPSAFAGQDTALYQGDGGDWLVKLMDGRIVGPFPGRPNIASLRYLNYPIPKNRYRWRNLNEEDIPEPEPEEEETPTEQVEEAVLDSEATQDTNAGVIRSL